MLRLVIDAIEHAVFERDEVTGRRLANSVTRAAGERSSPEAGNGLNGIRLNLHQLRPSPRARTNSISWRACSGWSLTPSSMQYSNVMKSRGAGWRTPSPALRVNAAAPR